MSENAGVDPRVTAAEESADPPEPATDDATQAAEDSGAPTEPAPPEYH
jgi:hypothetical protein